MIGTTLSHYRITAKLGEGGMGEVYRARDERLDRDVAIKVLPEEFTADPERLARFEREARVLASMNHPHIAQIHGLEDDGGRRFLVLELVEGETLAERIARGRIPVDDAVSIALQVARALEAAHEGGIVHRDIKPANVMLTRDGNAKVLDFGIARPLAAAAAGDMTGTRTIIGPPTRPGVVMGTPAYMSPEQVCDKPVDKRADIWAFGCVLWEMLTGSRPFTGGSESEVLAAVLGVEPNLSDLPAEVPPRIRRLVYRCLEKEPLQRLRDIGDGRVELQAVSAGEYTQDEPTAPTPIPAWRTWLPWAAAAVLAVVLVASAITGALSPRMHSQTRDVVRTTIALPSGTELTNVAFRQWSGPMRNELALSPDGRTLVFSAATEEGSSSARLYRRPMDRVEAEEIPGTEGGSAPFFSPDGKWIAFWARGHLLKVSLDGGLPTKLAEYRDPTGPYAYMGGSWSPDGTIFIGTHLDGLQRVSDGGGRLESLTVPDRDSEYAHRMPQVLPGGRAVLFSVAHGFLGAEGHIEALSLGTGERQVVVDSGLDGRFVPSGHLLFLEQGVLMAAPFNPDKVELTGPPVPVLEGVMHATNLTEGWANSGAGLFTVSNNGTMIFAPGGIASDRRCRLVWVDRNGRTEPVSAVPEGRVAYPRIAPDGRWLAFTTGGLESALWIHDLDRETTSRLTNEGRVIFSSWTPDSSRLVIGYSKGGVGNLYWLSCRGTEPMERLMTSEYLQQPGSWSPDARYLAYVQWRHSEGMSVWVLDMGDREAQPFFPTGHQYSYPDFSPDGRWIAYVSDESGRDEVWVTSFPGREQRMLVSNNGGIAPLWSPDGREMYYLSANTLMVVEVDAGPELTLGNPRTLIEVAPYPTGPLRGYDITPDGDRFIFAKEVESEPGAPPVRQLQVALNWFEELKRLVPTE